MENVVNLWWTTNDGQQTLIGKFSVVAGDVQFNFLQNCENSLIKSIDEQVSQILSHGVFDPRYQKIRLSTEGIDFLEVLPFVFNSAYLRAGFE